VLVPKNQIWNFPLPINKKNLFPEDKGPVNATCYAFYAFGSNARPNLASLPSREFAVLCSKESATLSSRNQTSDSSSALEDLIRGRCVDAAIGPRVAAGHFQRETPSSSRKPSPSP
jgi:hypothetical protein